MAGDVSKRVLVVDDDFEMRRLLVGVLRQRSLDADEAADGKEAIDLLREHRYSVIVLDLLMPVVDGFAVLEMMESENLQPPPVVLVLTGADQRITETLDPQRIHGIVRKPFDVFEIASIVVACSEIRSRGSLETMALAMISGAPLLDLLRRFGG